jgi:uncharacterized protein (DUF4415 family)
MNKKSNPELISKDNPEWTDDMFNRAIRFDQLPTDLQAKLQRITRGAQKAPTKERISIRLSPEVVAPFRATGSGWQTRLDAALKDWLKTHSPT